MPTLIIPGIELSDSHACFIQSSQKTYNVGNIFIPISPIKRIRQKLITRLSYVPGEW